MSLIAFFFTDDFPESSMSLIASFPRTGFSKSLVAARQSVLCDYLSNGAL